MIILVNYYFHKCHNMSQYVTLAITFWYILQLPLLFLWFFIRRSMSHSSSPVPIYRILVLSLTYLIISFFSFFIFFFFHSFYVGRVRHSPNRNAPDTMAYNSNRRLQSSSIPEAEDNKLRLGIILALGGGAKTLNGIMSVWDSWINNFFSKTSETTSLILLLDERDFRNFNLTKSVSEYIDILLVKNMGATPIKCAVLGEKFVGFSGNGNSSGHASHSKNVPKHVHKHIPKKCNNKLAGLDQVSTER